MARWLVLAGLVAIGCESDPGAVIHITSAGATRGADGKVSIALELLARESLGRNVGRYCVLTTFAADDFEERCDTDLEDGSTKREVFVAKTSPAAGAELVIRVRLGATDTLRALAAPP